MLPELLYEGYTIRMGGTVESPYFVAVDVCKALGIRNPSDALRYYTAEEKGIERSDTPGGRQNLLVPYKSGVYRFALRSDKGPARNFQEWICDEVLPCIEKYGTYPAPVVHNVTMRPFLHRTQFCLGIAEKLPTGYWCVFTHAATLLVEVEKFMGTTDVTPDEYDLLDGSVGKHWSLFRHRQPWAAKSACVAAEAPLSASNSVTGRPGQARPASQDAAIVVASTLPLTSAGVSEPSRSA